MSSRVSGFTMSLSSPMAKMIPAVNRCPGFLRIAITARMAADDITAIFQTLLTFFADSVLMTDIILTDLTSDLAPRTGSHLSGAMFCV